MGIIRRPEPIKPVKIEDADIPVEDNVVCIVEESDNGNTVEIICAPEELIKELTVEPVKSEIKPKAVITSTATGEQFGTWLPILRSSGTIDIETKNAFYTKVGQLVTCTFDIVVTSMSGGKKDSSIMLDGLPVVGIGATGTIAGSAQVAYFKVSNLDVRHITGVVDGNDTRVNFWCQKRGPGGLVPLTQIDINVGTVLAGTITYISN